MKFQDDILNMNTYIHTYILIYIVYFVIKATGPQHTKNITYIQNIQFGTYMTFTIVACLQADLTALS